MLGLKDPRVEEVDPLSQSSIDGGGVAACARKAMGLTPGLVDKKRMR